MAVGQLLKIEALGTGGSDGKGLVISLHFIGFHWCLWCSHHFSLPLDGRTVPASPSSSENVSVEAWHPTHQEFLGWLERVIPSPQELDGNGATFALQVSAAATGQEPGSVCAKRRPGLAKTWLYVLIQWLIDVDKGGESSVGCEDLMCFTY